MTINLTCKCRQCSSKKYIPATGELSNAEYSILKCNSGHSVKYFLDLPDYPLFFDHGIDAYVDGNYFEAFTSIYHSWERFIFTASQVFLIQSVPDYQEVQKIMKSSRKMSTKLEGGFSLLYGNYFKTPAPTLNNTLIKLRNDIIHGTHNPQRKDVEKCAQEIFNFIRSTEIKLYLDTEPYSLVEIYASLRENYLFKTGVLRHDELKQGLSQITKEGQCILGTTPYLSSIASSMLTFEDMIAHRKGIREAFESLSRINKK